MSLNWWMASTGSSCLAPMNPEESHRRKRRKRRGQPIHIARGSVTLTRVGLRENLVNCKGYFLTGPYSILFLKSGGTVKPGLAFAGRSQRIVSSPETFCADCTGFADRTPDATRAWRPGRPC